MTKKPELTLTLDANNLCELSECLREVVPFLRGVNIMIRRQDGEMEEIYDLPLQDLMKKMAEKGLL